MMATHERLVICDACGRKLRPCNLERHQRAWHMPRPRKRVFGKKFQQPQIPITVGRDQDRRYDAIAPRGEGPEQFRLYKLRAGELLLVATSDSPQGIGLALFTLHAEGEFIIDDSIGVLNTATEPAVWLANPWALGRRNNPNERFSAPPVARLAYGTSDREIA